MKRWCDTHKIDWSTKCDHSFSPSFSFSFSYQRTGQSFYFISQNMCVIPKVPCQISLSLHTVRWGPFKKYVCHSMMPLEFLIPLHHLSHLVIFALKLTLPPCHSPNIYKLWPKNELNFDSNFRSTICWNVDLSIQNIVSRWTDNYIKMSIKWLHYD